MGRRAAQKELRRRQIFEAAIRLFGAQGFAATTIEEIAAAADIAKGTFFNYFPTKESVLLHMNDMQIVRLRTLTQSTPGFHHLHAIAQIKTLLRVLAAGVTEQRALLPVIAAEVLLHPPAWQDHQQTISDNLDRLLSEILAKGQHDGDVRHDIPATELGELLSNLYFMTILSWLNRPERDLAEMLERSVDLAFEGIGAGPH